MARYKLQPPEEDPYPDADVEVVKVYVRDIRGTAELDKPGYLEISFTGFLTDTGDGTKAKDEWARLQRALADGTAYFMVPPHE